MEFNLKGELKNQNSQKKSRVLTESQNLEQIILGRIKSDLSVRSSLLTKFNNQSDIKEQQSQQQSPAMLPSNQTEQSNVKISGNIQSIFLDRLSEMLDTKLNPIADKLHRIQQKFSRIQFKQQNRIIPNPSNSIISGLDIRLGNCVKQIVHQSKETISHGLKYYNENLIERQLMYKHDQQNGLNVFFQSCQSMKILMNNLADRSSSYDRIEKNLKKLHDIEQQNKEILVNISNEIDKVSLNIERFQQKSIQIPQGQEFQEMEIDEQQFMRYLTESMGINPNYLTQNPYSYPIQERHLVYQQQYLNELFKMAPQIQKKKVIIQDSSYKK